MPFKKTDLADKPHFLQRKVTSLHCFTHRNKRKVHFGPTKPSPKMLYLARLRLNKEVVGSHDYFAYTRLLWTNTPTQSAKVVTIVDNRDLLNFPILTYQPQTRSFLRLLMS